MTPVEHRAGHRAGGETAGYRPDIDGLRFVAVMPVMLFHAGIPGFGGGYVGVDVFFVISGYLITGIIAKDMARGRFSIWQFYERRARRILPALMAVVAAASLVALIVMLPDRLANFGRSVSATALFYSNFHFWRATGYFSESAEFSPLLHTWSLAVEEQYYIFYPLLLLSMRRLAPGIRLALLVCLFSMSLLFAVWAVAHSQTAAFYFSASRAWELLLGGLLVFCPAPPRMPRWIAEATAAAALLAILVPVALYAPETPFPGLAALPPCLGTAALIATGAGGGTFTARILGWRPISAFGLISYSMYLWHWPLLAFLRIWLDRIELGTATGLAVLVASTALAALSWRFVEQPFRRGTVVGRAGALRLAAASIAVAGVLGAFLFATGGLPGRFPDAVNRLVAAASDSDPRSRACASADGPGGLCRIGLDGGQPADFLLWGDSHAGALLPAMDIAARRTGHSGLAAARNACAPLLGVWRIGREDARACTNFNDEVLARLAKNRQTIRHVFLSARWALSVTGLRAPGEAGRPVILADAQGQAASLAGNAEIAERGLRRTIEAITALGIAVTVIEGIPEIGWNVPRSLARAEAWGRPLPPPPSAADYASRNRPAAAMMQRIRETAPFATIPTASTFCPGDCIVALDGTPIYVDEDHLSVHGAIELLAPALETALGRFD